MSDVRGTPVEAAPVLRSMLPLAGALQVFSTHVVMTVIVGFGIGRGVPKLQPVLVQSGSAEFTAGVAVVGPMSHEGPVQFRVKRLIDPLGTGPSGTSELPPPMLRPPHFRVFTDTLLAFCASPQLLSETLGMKSRMVGVTGVVVDVVELELVVVGRSVDEVELVVVDSRVDEVELVVVGAVDETTVDDVVVDGASPGH